MEVRDYANSLDAVLRQLNLKAKVIDSKKEGAFLVFDLSLQSGGKFKQLEKYATEIALALKAVSEPLVYPVIHRGVIRLELMVAKPDTVYWQDIANSEEFGYSNSTLPLALGQLRSGMPLIADLKKMPHLLIGGATGSGKSIMLHTIIHSLIDKSRKKIKLALVDVKKVEFSYYKSLSQLYAPIAQDIDQTAQLLSNLIDEMELRFTMLQKEGVRDISTYPKHMPYIVVIIDEFADLMMVDKKTVQDSICRLAQKSRACGIHLVLATQRPSVDVVTGLVKANFPARIGCHVSAQVDSRVLLDKSGAEKLFGKGDAIIDCSEFQFKRFQGAFISEAEIIKTVANNKKSWWGKIWNG